MNHEHTLSIIKPDAVKRNIIGKIITYFEQAGLKIVAQKMLHLTNEQASEFYKEHAHRPFYQEFVITMTASPVVLLVLEGENAIAKNREIMGSTNPSEANVGTIRKDLGISIGENSVHGSDSITSAVREVNFFFTKNEILG